MISPRLPRAAAPAAALALAVGLAGCTRSTAAQQSKLQRPSAVAIFNGITTKVAGVHPYLAVANAARQDLVLVDAVDDTAVLGPIQFRPLTVPVPDPAPAALVSATLGDSDPDASLDRLPDLLVVAADGSNELQLVQTWNPATVVDPTPIPLPADASVLSLVAVAIPDGAGQPVIGKARVIAGLTGQRLAVVDFKRQITVDAKTQAKTYAIVLDGAPVIAPLGFDALSLAVPYEPVWRRSGDGGNGVGPSNLTGLLGTLYAASTDPIPDAAGQLGVARIDMSGPITDWGTAVTRLDTRGAPTRLVAAWRLRERKQAEIFFAPVNPADYAGVGYPGNQFEDVAVERVYAALDPSGCGVDLPIPCGIAILDPATGGLRADPAGLMPYLAPMSVAGQPTAMTISAPPVAPPTTDVTSSDHVFGGDTFPYEKLIPGSGTTATTALMAVPVQSGRVFFYDLARWAPPSESDLLRSGIGATVRTVAGSNQPSDTVDVAPLPVLGVVNPTDGLVYTSSTLSTLSSEQKAAALASVKITPGFGVFNAGGLGTWNVRKEGVLPGLDRRRAESGGVVGGVGTPWVALQYSVNGTVYADGRLYDPTLGVQVGDLVVVLVPSVIPGCTIDSTTTPELEVTGFLAPDPARWPGGAVTVQAHGTIPKPCMDAIGAGAAMQVAVRAGKLVVTHEQAGYIGRIAQDPPQDPPAAVNTYTFTLAYPAETEDALAPLCPILPWPADLATAPAAFFACTDATCRADCERLGQARRARRSYTLSTRCKTSTEDTTLEDVTCRTTWPLDQYPFPNVNGPVIHFVVSLAKGKGTTTVPALDATYENLPRDATLTIGTLSGLSYFVRATPGTLGTSNHPAGVTTFDRGHGGKPGDFVRYFVPYLNAEVLDTSPAQANNSAGVIR